MMTHVYITVGATISFDLMIETIFTDFMETFLEKLFLMSGEEIHIVAQCGTTYIDLFEKHVLPQISRGDILVTTSEYIKVLETGDIRSICFAYKKKTVSISFFNLSSNLDKFLKTFRPNMVISHAGTGSLLDALANKNSESSHIIAVVNESLMNNHQLEIGEKLQSYGLLTCCKSIPELRSHLQEHNFATTDSLPQKNLNRGFNETFKKDILMF